MQHILIGFITSLIALGIGCLTVLKETPSFWLNSGGYPVALRHFVLDFYYPLLGVYLLALALLTAHAVIGLIKTRSFRAMFLIVALTPAWLLTAVNIGLLIANNVVNLINGLPLHAH
jgi:hypothetical protein